MKMKSATPSRVEHKKKSPPKKVRRAMSAREKVSKLVREKLKPVAKTPSGRNIYDYDELAALNFTWPHKE